MKNNIIELYIYLKSIYPVVVNLASQSKDGINSIKIELIDKKSNQNYRIKNRNFNDEILIHVTWVKSAVTQNFVTEKLIPAGIINLARSLQ